MNPGIGCFEKRACEKQLRKLRGQESKEVCLGRRRPFCTFFFIFFFLPEHLFHAFQSKQRKCPPGPRAFECACVCMFVRVLTWPDFVLEILFAIGSLAAVLTFPAGHSTAASRVGCATWTRLDARSKTNTDWVVIHSQGAHKSLQHKRRQSEVQKQWRKPEELKKRKRNSVVKARPFGPAPRSRSTRYLHPFLRILLSFLREPNAITRIE